MALYGYARVSSKGQCLDRQLVEFEKMELDKIFSDKETGHSFNRTNYKKLMRILKAGDVVFVYELNRFGRNYDEIKEEWYRITKIKRAHIVVMNMPLLDTRETNGLIGVFIADIVLQVLAYVAEQQWNDIRKAQAEGIAVAKQRGVKFGRPRLLIDEELFERVIYQYQMQEISFSEAARRVNMSRSGFRRRYAEFLAQKYT